jgi:hypothetical protein
MHQIEIHLKELSLKLEERHQRMTLLMRPIEDDSDAEWKKFCTITGKQDQNGNN